MTYIRQPAITVRAVQPVTAALRALGHDPQPLFEACQIDQAVLEDADGLISHAAMMQFWDAAVAATGDPALGLHLAEAVSMEALGLHAYALLSSPTLQEAYRKGARYQRLIHDATELVFDEDEPTVGVLRHALPGGHSVPRQPAEFLVALWVRLGRLLVDDAWTPEQVLFAHGAPADGAEHLRFFHITPHFASGQTALYVAAEILARPSHSANPGLASVLDDYAVRLLQQRPTLVTLSDHVRSHLQQNLESGPPTASAVARALDMSVRTLRRSLANEDTSFRALLDQVRHTRAVELLRDPRLSTAEIGYLLGFTELSAFYRAFKRWTGMTPAEARGRLKT